MIRVQFEIEKMSEDCPELVLRKYFTRDGVVENEDDTGFLLSSIVMDMMECMIRCLEDDFDSIDELRTMVRERARSIGK